MVILTATKKQDFTLFGENTLLEKLQWEFKVTPLPPPAFLGSIYSVFFLQGKQMMMSADDLRETFLQSTLYITSIYQAEISSISSYLLSSFLCAVTLINTYALSNPCAQTTGYIALSPEGPWTITNIIQSQVK